MGHEVNLHVDVGPARLIAVMPAPDYEALDRADGCIHLSPDPDGLHIFDKADGANVSLAG
jgi:oligogalacturonide transport system ATP-binding protein